MAEESDAKRPVADCAQPVGAADSASLADSTQSGSSLLNSIDASELEALRGRFGQIDQLDGMSDAARAQFFAGALAQLRSQLDSLAER